MKKRLLLLTGLASLAFVVSGCGSNNESKEKDSNPPVEKKAENTSKAPKSEPVKEETDKGTPTSGQGTTGETKNNEGNASEQTITYEVDGKKVEEKTKSASHDSLSLNILPNFQLDQEEPGKYVVIDQKTGNMMRIEKAPDKNIGDIHEEIKMRTKAVSEEIIHNETTGTDLDGAIHYKAFNGNDVVNIIYLPNQQVILTIFEKKSSENISPYVAMAKTIKWK